MQVAVSREYKRNCECAKRLASRVVNVECLSELLFLAISVLEMGPWKQQNNKSVWVCRNNVLLMVVSEKVGSWGRLKFELDEVPQQHSHCRELRSGAEVVGTQARFFPLRCAAIHVIYTSKPIRAAQNIWLHSAKFT